MERVIKSLILILIIICIILAVIIAVLKNETINESSIAEGNTINQELNIQEIIEKVNESYKPEDFYEDYAIRLIQNKADYKALKTAINKYVSYCSNLNSNEEDKRISLKSVLDEIYLEEYNYNELYSEFSKYSNGVIIDKIYEKELSERIKAYIVYGYLRDTQEETKMLIFTDKVNMAFSILPQEYIEKYNYDENNEENITNLERNNIEKNEYNVYDYTSVTEEEHVKMIFQDYIEKQLYCTNLAYEYLNQEYREEKFGSLDKYIEFTKSNKETLMLYDAKNVKPYGEFESHEAWQEYFDRLKLLEVEEYLITDRENYTEYVVIDTYGNYYIFSENTVMNYNVILDTYTIDIPEFVEQYDEASDSKKVEMNIKRFFEAIYANDYEFAYKKLNDNFKNQNFDTVEKFEEYVKNELINIDEMNFREFSELDGVYTYIVEFVIEENVISRTFAVELLEGTGFKLSFNII